MKKIMPLIALSIALVACGQPVPEADVASAPADMARAAPNHLADSMGGAELSMTEASEPASPQAKPEVKKYVALRHQLMVEVEAPAMQTAFDAAVAHCEALQCQLISANFHRHTQFSPPSAFLHARIPPRHVALFLDGLAKGGEIVQHGREAEDKTHQVVDTEARIKNLTELRDRLRLMLTDKSARFKDIIEVERELASTQSQLESLLSMRKVLALETDLVEMHVSFSAKQGITQQGFFAPVVNAVKKAGHVMVESLAKLITFVVNLLPWLVFGIPVLLVLRKLWRKSKQKS